MWMAAVRLRCSLVRWDRRRHGSQILQKVQERYQMQRNRIVSFLFGLTLLLTAFGGATAKAQTAVDGAIGGTVEDTSGGAIPGASVVVINKATNATQTVIADKAGVYRAIHLQPGEYTVTVNATGYGAFSSSDVTVQVGLLTALQPMLNVGAAAD